MKIDITIFITTFLMLLTFVKAIETVKYNIIHTLIHGRKRLRKFESDLKNNGANVAVKNYIENRPNAMFFNRRINPKWSFVSDYFYRWFIIVPLTSFSMLVTKNHFIVWVAIYIVLISIAIEILNEFVERLWNGVASNIHFNAQINVAIFNYDEMDLSVSEVIKRISISLILRFSVICLGFAGIYYKLHEMNKCAFKGIETYIDAVYFSIVTVTTTGFGEILPTLQLSKFFVICQIILSWLLLLVMVLHYGTTLTSKLELYKPNQANSADAKSRGAPRSVK